MDLPSSAAEDRQSEAPQGAARPGMRLQLRERAKQAAGSAVGLANPQCSFDRCIFILGHMRCGSTALSNVFCSRGDVSGYGEAHIEYSASAPLGRLVVNQALRRAWTPGARYLFDKILHSTLDADAPPEFFQARAIFIAREPVGAVASIRKLFAGADEYRTDREAAGYYLERLEALRRAWRRFPPQNRVGLTYDVLRSNPEAALSLVSAALRLTPPLENRYVSKKASRRPGGGDPVVSGRLNRIVAQDGAAAPSIPLELSPGELQRLHQGYAEFVNEVVGQPLR